MANDASIEALKRHAAATSDKKARAVLQAIDSMLAAGLPITVAGVARAASVSREFIHSHRRLHEAVTAGARRADAEAVHALAPHSSAAQRSDRAVLTKKIEQQRQEIAALQESIAAMRARLLGAQLAADEYVNPEEHAELRITNARLMDENTSLGRQLKELRRLNGTLEDELAASRLAHAQDVAEIATRSGVISLDGRRDGQQSRH
ncbi:DUF6262 family protein [Cellulomonas sp. GbtcB1]|uniref:DUF6262 family protein n=1 Tax=Cellulomonas sp. GbtcB1 TaxID=2824746 RepID=UPI001C2F5153|nr:DUF6262 family protein [Cellulomonas sp. GbtcB1]